MKVVFHEDFHSVYISDPAAARGRMAAVVEDIVHEAEWVSALPATDAEIGAVHSRKHMAYVHDLGLHGIAALAAGATVQAAEIGLAEPCFALVRPPGHHASADSSWGFCYYNNMAVALTTLHARQRIRTATVLDIDLHYGDGTENIFGTCPWASVLNVESADRRSFMGKVERAMASCKADIIGISAGFDNHRQDWGGLLETDDYFEIGRLAARAARRIGGGCFAVLEGGYNHQVLGANVLALMQGMDEGWPCGGLS